MINQLRKSSLIIGVVCILVGLGLAVLLQGCGSYESPRSISGIPYGSSTAVANSIVVQGAPVGGSRRSAYPELAGSEELWILARGETPAARPDQTPGSGMLMASLGGREVPMPLKHTDVRASVNGYIGTVEVTQQFL